MKAREARTKESSSRGGAPGRRGLRFNLGWTATSAAASQGALFVLNLVLARLLGGDDLADFLIILTLTQVVPAVFSLGMERLGVVLLANAPRLASHGYIRSLLTIAAVSSTFAGVFSAVVVEAGPFLHSATFTIAVWAGVFVGLENARIMIADLPRAWSRADSAAVAGPAPQRLVLLAGVIVLHFTWGYSPSLEVLLALSSLATAAPLAYGVVSALRLAATGPAGIRRSGGGLNWRTVVKAGMPLSLANVSLVALGQADSLVVSAHFAPAVVASYILVSRTSNLLGNVKTMVNVALMPVLSKRPADRIDAAAQIKQARGAMSVLFYGCLPILAILAIGSEQLFSWLFGAEYAAAASAAFWLFGGQVVSVAMGLAGTVLLREGRQVTIMWVQTISAVLSVAAIASLAISGDIRLVGIASGAGTAFCAVLMAVIVRKKYGIATWALDPVTFAKIVHSWFSRRRTSSA